MIDQIAGKLAVKIKSTVPEHPASVNVLKYSLSLIINALLIVLLSFGISLILGKTLEVAYVLISFAILRQVSGGLHLKSGVWCVVASTLGTTTISLISMSSTWTHVITFIALCCMVAWAPTSIEKQSRIPTKFYPILKLISCIVVSSNFLIQSDVIALAFVVQAVLIYLERR